MQWLPPDRWEALKQGSDCPMCADMHWDENPFSFFVTRLRQSIVRLPRNQYLRGWAIVIFNRHVNELFELNEHELLAF